jgi:hypothetical protein
LTGDSVLPLFSERKEIKCSGMLIGAQELQFHRLDAMEIQRQRQSGVATSSSAFLAAPIHSHEFAHALQGRLPS